ncbi:MAG: LPS export ABC transporter periplasmic protein LptC [Oscillatoriales cyanobacterium SM2_2_1]|nr:LPS export ABC transporter periplasmic protein LptC [Oscillatoriales cyanobacterium SM2_2_1]
MSIQRRLLFAFLGLLVLAFVPWLIGQNTLTPITVPSPTEATSSLFDIRLTEFDQAGKLLWEVNAERIDYRQDRRVADVQKVSGRFYRDGELLITATSDTGVLNQVEQQIAMKGNVRAIAVKDNLTLTAAEILWNSKKDLMTGSGTVTIRQPKEKLSLTGQRLEARPSQNRFTLSDNVLGTAAKPPLEIRGRQITWDADRQRVFTDRPLTVLQATDRLTLSADRGQWDIAAQTLEVSGKVTAKDPSLELEILTTKAVWNLKRQIVTLPQAFTAVSAARGITVAAQTGSAQLQQESIFLQGQVKSSFQSTQGTVTADAVEWLIPSQRIIATGNIFYQQPERNLTVRGDRAVAQLDQQNIEVSGGSTETQLNVP